MTYEDVTPLPRIPTFYASILIMGFSPVFFQVLLLRELISNFFANELIVAIVLALWLVVEALGSGLLYRPLLKRVDPTFLYSVLLTVNALLGPLSLFLARTIRNILYLQFGEQPNLLLITLGTLLVIFPLAAVDGCMFTVGYHMGDSLKKIRPRIVGRVYAIESLGAALGGISVTVLILLHLSPFFMILALSFVNAIGAISVILGLSRVRTKRTVLSSLPSLLGLGAVFFLSLNLSWLEETSTALRWREYDVLAFKNSPYHNIVLTEKGNQKCLFVDGRASVSLPQGDVVSREAFAHIPLSYADHTERILLIGEGVGGLIGEFLKYPQIRIDYLQLDPEIIRTLTRADAPLIRSELSSPRVEVLNEDPVSYIKRAQAAYDAVFIAEGCPSTFLSGRYFTVEFFADLKRVLSKRGFVALKTPGGESYITEELKRMLSTIYATLDESFRFTHFVPGEELILLASDGIRFSTVPLSEVITRFRGRNLQTQYLSPYALEVRYHPAKVGLFQRIFEGAGHEIHSVNKPTLVNEALSYESSIYDPAWARVLGSLRELPGSLPFLLFLMPLVFLVLISRASQGARSLIIPLTIGLTGLAGMVGSMAITIFFQEVLGSLYLKMGLIFSSFMLGVFVSALTISRGLPERFVTERVILLVECSLCILFVCLVGVFWRYASIGTGGATLLFVEVSLYVMNFLLGCLVGIEFPVASSLLEKEGKGAGGVLYAADLVGAFVGSMIVVTLIVPVFGFLSVFLLLASLKVVNVLLVLSKILSR